MADKQVVVRTVTKKTDVPRVLARGNQKKKAKKQKKAMKKQQQVVIRKETKVVQPKRKQNGQKKKKGARRKIPSNWFLNAIANPFGVTGAKVPDIVATKSGTFKTFTQFTMSTITTTGECAIAVFPRIEKHYYTASAIAAGTYTWDAGTDSSAKTGLETFWQSVRPVSMGVKLMNITSNSNNSGQLACALSYKVSVPTAFTSWSIVAAQPNSVTENSKQEYFALWRPQDNADWEYQDPTTTLSYPALFISLKNGPTAAATAYFNVEITAHYEAIPKIAAGDMVETDISPVSPGLLSQTWEFMNQLPTMMVMGKTGAVGGALLMGKLIAHGNSPNANFVTRRVANYYTPE